jgi:DNA-binding transcriptional LysR family regulator
MFVGVTEEIVSGLLDCRFDLGLISLPVSDEKLNIMPLFEEELLLLRPAPNRIRRGQVSSIPTSELEDVPFVLYPKRSNMRTMIDRFFGEIGVKPRVVMEADDTEAIKGLVEAGFGYSILPEHALRGRARNGYGAINALLAPARAAPTGHVLIAPSPRPRSSPRGYGGQSPPAAAPFP